MILDDTVLHVSGSPNFDSNRRQASGTRAGFINKICSLINMKTKEAFCITKALKYKYNMPITKTLGKTNFAEFYHNINTTNNCDDEVANNILKEIRKLKENLMNLKKEGINIIKEENKFKKLNWSGIISNLKTELNVTNKKLEIITGCDHRNFSMWEIGIKIPNYQNCKIILDLISNCNLNIDKLSNKEGLKHTYRDKYSNINPLKVTSETAEVIGIINGDGTVTKSGLISITGNPTEDFMHHKYRVQKLIKKIFKKNINAEIKDGLVKSKTTSRYIAKQLNKIGVPLGKKVNLRIPNTIIRNKTLIKYYLRGLFDTDGTVCRRNKYNIRIGYGSFSEKEFTKDVFIGLKKLKFGSTYLYNHTRHRVEIIDDFEVIKFFKNIGSCNHSKIGKFLYWRLNKFCPSYNYLTIRSKLKEYRIDIEKLNLPFLWSYKYISLTNKNIRRILLSKIKEDELKLKTLKLRSKINWKNLVSALRKQFKLKILTKELNCNYKTIWQWEKGTRKPNLEMCVNIIKFCKKNKIKF